MALKKKFKTVYFTQVFLRDKHEKFACFDRASDTYIGDVYYNKSFFLFVPKTSFLLKDQIDDVSSFMKQLTGSRARPFK